jgi:hypothetical protein
MKNYQNTALVLEGGGYKAYFANPTKFVMDTNGKRHEKTGGPIRRRIQCSR